MGRRNFLGFHRTNCGPTLIGYAWLLWNETKGLELMDPLLKDSCSPNEFLRYVDHHDQVRAQDCSANGLTISIDVAR
ncbi:hypothetical protein ACFX14_036833 [Malus domestica]